MKELNGVFMGQCRLNGKKVLVKGLFSSFDNTDEVKDTEIIYITYHIETLAGNEAYLKKVDGKWRYGKLNEKIFQELPSEFHEEVTLIAVKAYTQEKIQVLKAK